MSAWTQAICDDCFEQQQPDRRPHRMVEPDVERCSWCGRRTRSGIYLRADPASVPYPASDD